MDMMILSIVKISPLPGKRKEILDILLSIKGPIQATHGCLACNICEEEEEERIIFYLEHWRSWADLIQHIHSNLYTRMLEAMELSRRRPEIFFYEISDIKGMELIETVLNPQQ